MAEPREWMGTPPQACDICMRSIKYTFVDGKTKGGPWANMCPACYKHYGVGLGTGLGQMYELTEGHWFKTKG